MRIAPLYVAAALIAWSAAATAPAQEATKLRRVGLLMPSTQAATAELVASFEQGLREHGYESGRNIALEYRYTDGRTERVGEMARELAQKKVEVIVTTTDPVVRAVSQQVGVIPIVMVNTSDPVGAGLVKSLAKPGGTVTGLTNFSPEITAKRIELLRQAVPTLSRIAYLWNPDLAGAAAVYRDIQAAGRLLGVEILSAEVRRAEELDAAFAGLAAASATALLVQAPNPLLYTRRAEIARRANEKRMPSMFNRREYVADGGLMSYGPSVRDMYRRAAGYVDAILKGGRAEELPVEQPRMFELLVNVKTARLLDVQIPQAVLMQAQELLD